MGEAHLEAHFGSMGAQRRAGQLGMWIFLATEVLLFAGLLTGYSAFRAVYPEDFAQAARHMNVAAGTINTYVLIISSVFVALGVHLIRQDRGGACAGALAAAMVLGAVFLGIKGYEYAEHARHGALPGPWYGLGELPRPGAVIFFTLYFLLTGLHALHLLVAEGVLAVVAFRAAAQSFDRRYHAPVELGGMYWHLVDVIWIFLYPLFYLVVPAGAHP